MTIQTLIDCWVASGMYYSAKPPATEEEIRSAEAKIGSSLPPLLREMYRCTNGDWIFNLDFYPLEPISVDKSEGLTNVNEMYIEFGWHIPQEILLFANDHAEQVYGIWLPETGSEIFIHPIIEVGELPGEDGCMGVAGTNLVSFLRGWSAFSLVSEEYDELRAVEAGADADAPNRLKRLQTTLDRLQVPQSLRSEHFDEAQFDDAESLWVDHHFAQLRKWADPLLPDPYGDSYDQRYTIGDLKQLFGET